MPEQSDRDCRSVYDLAPWDRSIGFAGVGARASSAGCGDEQLHAQRRGASDDADAVYVAGTGGYLAASLGLCRRIELNAPSLFIANVEDPATIANVLLNPPATFGQGPARGAGIRGLHFRSKSRRRRMARLRSPTRGITSVRRMPQSNAGD